MKFPLVVGDFLDRAEHAVLQTSLPVRESKCH